MKNLLPLLALSLSTLTVAGTSVVPAPNKWALRDPSVTPIAELGRYDTQALCQAAALTLTKAGTYRCDTSVTLTVTIDCTGVVKPVIPRKLDADGFVIDPPIRGKEPTSGNDWTTEIEDYVPIPVPPCWVKGWREITQADLTTEAELAALPPEPDCCWSEALQANWDSEGSRARRFNHAVDGDEDPVATP